MKIEVEVPDWTKAITVSYVYYADGGDGNLTMGVRVLTGQDLEAAIREEDDGK